MQPLEQVHKLRPTNVASRLGQKRAPCVLNPRDLYRALADVQAVTVAFELALARPLAAGVFAAARALDAVVGITVPVFGMGEGPSPYSQFQDLCAAAEEVNHRLPVYLAAGPLELASADETALHAARELVFRYVDAGFTAVVLDASRLGLAEAANALAEVSAPLRERELSVEVVTAEATASGVAELLASLRARGVAPDVVHLRGKVLGDARELVDLAQAARPAVLALEGAAPARMLAAAGVRRASVSAPFDALCRSVLPAEVRDAVQGAQGSLARALGPHARALEALDPAAREKLEALAFHEASDVLEAAGAKGTASRAVAFLAEKSGY